MNCELLVPCYMHIIQSSYAYYSKFNPWYSCMWHANTLSSRSPGIFRAYFSGISARVGRCLALSAWEKIALKHAICISWLEKIGDLAVASVARHILPAMAGDARSVLRSPAGAHCNTPRSTGEVGSSIERTLCAAILQIESQSRWHDHHNFKISSLHFSFPFATVFYNISTDCRPSSHTVALWLCRASISRLGSQDAVDRPRHRHPMAHRGGASAFPQQKSHHSPVKTIWNK